MGMDDDDDCLHDWQLVEVIAGAGGAETVSRCVRCDAVQYEPSGNGR